MARSIFFIAFTLTLVVIALAATSSSGVSALAVESLKNGAKSSAAGCHNATGSCTETHFVCANEEMIPHSRRCDGVEDCADGTDEYMCDQTSTPIMERSFAERSAIQEVSCIKCTCYKGQITITTTSTAAWRAIAFASPRDKTLLTSASSQQNKPCSSTYTNTLTLNVYKKQNKGCRGWVCCFRQEYCNACNSGKLPTNNCYV